jgi:serine/threonine protein kinase
MYALGATFFYLLTRTPPVRGDSVYDILVRKIKIDYLSPKKILAEKIPESISRVIEKMTALDPDNRYPSFEDLRQDLERIGAGQAPRAKTPPIQKEKGNSRKALAAVAAFLLVLTGLSGVAYQRFQQGTGDPTQSLSIAAAATTPQVPSSDGTPAATHSTVARPNGKNPGNADERGQLTAFRRRAEQLSGKVVRGAPLHEARVGWKMATELEGKLSGIIQFGPVLRDTGMRSTRKPRP